MIPILAALFYIAFPALVLYLCHRFPALEKLGAALICFVAGMVLANIGAVPGGLGGVQKIIMSVSVPLAIPLMIFPTNVVKWARIAGKSLLSFAIFIISVIIVAAAGYAVYAGSINEAHKVAGMYVAGFTGATMNFMSVALALKASPETIVVATAASWFIEIFWLLFMMFLGQRVIGLLLKPFDSPAGKSSTITDEAAAACASEDAGFDSYAGIFSREKFIPMLAALGISLVIFAAGTGLYYVSPEEYNMTVLMLAVSTLGICCSFMPRIRRIEMSYPLGQYIILIFCITIATTVDFSELLKTSGDILVYTVMVIFGSTLLHVIACKPFGIDRDTQIITATAGIFSPVFVPVVASTLKNREVIVGGLAAGIIGYATGNYLGITMAYLFKAWL